MLLWLAVSLRGAIKGKSPSRGPIYESSLGERPRAARLAAGLWYSTPGQPLLGSVGPHHCPEETDRRPPSSTPGVPEIDLLSQGLHPPKVPEAKQLSDANSLKSHSPAGIKPPCLQSAAP